MNARCVKSLTTLHEHNADLYARDLERCVYRRFLECDGWSVSANMPAAPTTEPGRHRPYRPDTRDGEPSSNNCVFLPPHSLKDSSLAPAGDLLSNCSTSTGLLSSLSVHSRKFSWASIFSITNCCGFHMSCFVCCRLPFTVCSHGYQRSNK